MICQVVSNKLSSFQIFNMDSRRVLAQCEICKNAFDVAVLLQSSSNEFYCKKCFKRSLYVGNKASAAGDTKTEILNKNGMKFMPDPHKHVQSSPLTNLLKGHQNFSVMSLSKRPLQCPKADCNKFVSVCTLESHFKHEHKEVAVVTTHLDARCASEFYPRDVRYGTTQCIVLLKVINGEFLNACRASRMTLVGIPLEDQKPVILLMSTRIADIHVASDDDETDASPERARGTVEEVFRKGDRIIVWLASNIQTNLSYTVAVSTMDNEIRQKFYGPLMTLNESPGKLCKEGECLILTLTHCIGMTENGTKPLALDVVIHSPNET